VRGHVRRPAGMKTWQTIYELGDQSAQRCQACGKRVWVERRRLERCPVCGGDLLDRTERRQGCRSGFRTRKEAEEALNEILGTLQHGTYVQPARINLGEYLRAEWLPAVKSTIRASTYTSYESHVLTHLIPGLGPIPLQKLSGSAINAFYAKLLVEGRVSRRKPPDPGTSPKKDAPEPELKPLSPTTVRHIHVTLHRALRDAVRWRRIQRNPADSADPPAVRQTEANEMKTWTGEQLKTFFETMRADRLFPLWRTVAMTGLRRGEALGLRWRDVDLEGASIAVRQALVTAGYEVRFSEPKTRRGRRALPLDAETVAILTEWRKAQKAERLKWGPAWTNTGLVFTRENGVAWHPDRITKLFEYAVKRSGLPRIRLHDLRHTHATLALAAGINPKTVSDRLGHASVAFTLDVYSHSIPAVAQDAADRIAALVSGAS